MILRNHKPNKVNKHENDKDCQIISKKKKKQQQYIDMHSRLRTRGKGIIWTDIRIEEWHRMAYKLILLPKGMGSHLTK